MNTKDIEKILISEEEIEKRVSEIADEINRFYGDNPLFMICILKGSTPFAVTLMKKLKMDVTLDFMAASSYGASTTSAGHLTIKKDITLDITDCDVLVVEDIIDTGITLTKVKEMLACRGAKSVRIASLLSKPSRRLVEIEADFLGFEIPDEFVIGYGLDYAEKYRNLPYVGILSRSVYEK